MNLGPDASAVEQAANGGGFLNGLFDLFRSSVKVNKAPKPGSSTYVENGSGETD